MHKLAKKLRRKSCEIQEQHLGIRLIQKQMHQLLCDEICKMKAHQKNFEEKIFANIQYAMVDSNHCHCMQNLHREYVEILWLGLAFQPSSFILCPLTFILCLLIFMDSYSFDYFSHTKMKPGSCTEARQWDFEQTVLFDMTGTAFWNDL
jgi:hypothetical protein